jgi:indolepyruvate ferredoxin oxidoreductase, beta subunit
MTQTETMNDKSITLLLCALGGEGGGVLSEWLTDIARHAGYASQSTSIPGVAQRTGATTYYLEVFPRPLSELGGRKPVFSLNPVPGALDALVSSELLETVRQIGNGMADPHRTQVITSSARSLTTHERMQLGDGRYRDETLVDVVRSFSREHHVLDMAALTREAGTVVSAVMLGTIAASGVLPFPREVYEHVVRAGGRGAQASLGGFARGFEAVSATRRQAEFVRGVLAEDTPQPERALPLPAAVAVRFPSAVHEMLTLGHARLTEYQDAAYARLYVDRLARVLDAEQTIDPAAHNGFATTREMARWLALWMAFDDIVRVADLKSRASRSARVRAEVKAGDADLVKVFDHFKPGVPEFAGLLPAAPAQALLRWDRKRQQRGLAPWGLKLIVGSHTVFGMTALRLLASLKWLRRRGQRFADEQRLIERWLDGVVARTQEHWRLGHEVALCGRLIKGYGSTNERGKDNLLHVLDQLAVAARFDSPEVRAAAIARAREAALADDAGKALDQALVQHGAAPRPVKEQPIRFVRRPVERPRKAA